MDYFRCISKGGVYFYFYKTGKINDRDGDYIPDEVEDAVEDVKERRLKLSLRLKKSQESQRRTW